MNDGHIIEKPSPNWNERPEGANISTVVLHYTGMPTAEAALARLCEAEAQVSAHYTITETGAVYRHVAEEHRAWHAGVSHWRGRDNVNDFSIGIELANPGHEFGYAPFPAGQITALITLLQGIRQRHAIHPANIIGHSDVAPLRKEDPGERFPWPVLARHGLGLAPSSADLATALPACGCVLARPGDIGNIITAIQNSLMQCGYGLTPSGTFDTPTVATITAFRRRFTPELLHPLWDERCASIVKDILAQQPEAR